MELTQRKIRRCLAIMEGHAEIISDLTKYRRDIEHQATASSGDDPPSAYVDEVTARLTQCKNLNARYLRDLQELLHSAESTRTLVRIPSSSSSRSTQPHKYY